MTVTCSFAATRVFTTSRPVPRVPPNTSTPPPRGRDMAWTPPIGAARGGGGSVDSPGLAISCGCVVFCASTGDAPASWPYVTASAVVHTIYQLLLVRMYAVGDFGQTYPIARGSSPLLVAVAAFFLAHEALSPQKIAGILFVCCGIMMLAFEGRRFH